RARGEDPVLVQQVVDLAAHVARSFAGSRIRMPAGVRLHASGRERYGTNLCPRAGSWPPGTAMRRRAPFPTAPAAAELSSASVPVVGPVSYNPPLGSCNAGELDGGSLADSPLRHGG